MAILNRLYNLDKKKWQKDTSNYWDFSTLESEFSATADFSTAILSGETKVNSTVYDFVGTLAVAGSSTDAAGSTDGISWTGLTNSRNNEWKQAKNGATVTFSVTEASVVALTAYQNGVGALTATVAGTKVVDNSSDCTNTAFLTSGAGEVVITFTGQTYFSKIAVSTRTDETNKAGAVSVTLASTQIAKSETTTATAKVTPYYLNNTGSDAISSTVTWSSSATSKATVNASTGAVSGVAAGEADIIATSTVTPTVSGKATLTLTESATTKVALTTWDWKSDSASIGYYTDSALTTICDKLEKKSGYVKGNSDKVILYVDASSGKLATNGTNNGVQFNSGTKIQVPVSNGSIVTVVAYSGSYYQSVTIGGTAMTSQTNKFTASSSGYVEVRATSNTYLNSISVTDVDYSETHSSAATGTVN